jgi:predicted kinase
MILILRGIPCSGKSTFTAKLKEKYPDAVVISNDEIRKERNIPFGSEDVNVYGLEILEDALKNDKDVIVDNTNIIDETLYRYTRLIKKHNKNYNILEFHISLEEALQRNEKRKPSIPPENIISAYNIFEYMYE